MSNVTMDIKAFVTPLLKWWWLIVLATLIAASGSYYALINQPDVYQSRATLLIGRAIDDPNPTGTQFTLGEQLAQSYADIARREPVRRSVMTQLSLTALPEHYIAAIPRTQLLEISVNDTSPERAQAVANAFAQQLVQLSPSSTDPEEQERQIFVDQQLDDLQQQIEETEAEIDAKQEELGAVFSAQEISELQTELSALQAKLNTLQSNFAALLESSQQVALNTVSIIEPASLPRAPVNPQMELTILAASAIGFLLAVVGAYLLDYLDDSIRTPTQIQRHTDLPTLTSVASMKLQGSDGKLVAHHNPRSPDAEAFRVLRTGINYSSKASASQTLLVTSPNLGDGKSVTAGNLAVVAAQSGHRVLLIDLDLHRPAQHNLFGLSNRHGITTLWKQGNDIPSAHQLGQDIVNVIQGTSVDNLFVLTCGPTMMDPSEFLASEKLQAILRLVLVKFDYVIVDSPPVLVVTDPLVLSSMVDSVLLVIRAGKTSRSELKQTVERLNRVGGHLLGVVLNRAADVDASYYYSEKYYQGEPASSKSPGRIQALLNRSRNGLHEKRDIAPTK